MILRREGKMGTLALTIIFYINKLKYL